MSINESELEKLSQLSRIRISKSEADKFCDKLNKIIKYVAKVQEYKFSNTDFQKPENKTKLRKDEVVQKDTEHLVEQFTDKENNLLKVKKVL